MIMANHNSFIHNTCLTEENALVHLLDTLSPLEDNEADVIEHSKYYDDVDFNNALQSYNSKISMLSLNCQSISAKFDKFKLFLDDVNNENLFRSYVFRRPAVIKTFTWIISRFTIIHVL